MIKSLDVLEKVITKTAFIITEIHLGTKGFELRDLWRRRTCRLGAGHSRLDVCRHKHFPIRAPEPAEKTRGTLGLLVGGDAGIAAAVRSAVRFVEVLGAAVCRC